MLVHLTNGARSYPDVGAVRSARRSQREAQRAASVLGCEFEWSGWTPPRLMSMGPSVEWLAQRVEALTPSVIITHWRGSWHPRHRLAHRLVLESVRLVRSRASVYFGENFEDLRNFQPSHYVDVLSTVETWWRSLSSYALYRESRAVGPQGGQRFPYRAYYAAAPYVRGLEAGLPVAQALRAIGRGGGGLQVIRNVAKLHPAVTLT